MKRGYMISIEGIDAVGKMTQTKLLHSWLEERGLRPAIVEFPDYATRIGQEIMAFLSGNREYPPEVRHMLFAANRWEKADQLRKMLESGRIVLVNRYTGSNLVYGIASGLGEDWLTHLEDGLPTPDLVIVLDAPPSTINSRRAERRDKYEQDASLQENVRSLYRKLAKRFGWIVVNAMGTIAETHKSVKSIVKQKMKFKEGT